MNNLLETYKDEIASHFSWLEKFGNERRDRWENLLKANQQSAICEACLRYTLSKHVDFIEPNENLSNGGPDFLCKKQNDKFYVEVTCISVESATKITSLAHPLSLEPKASCYYRRLTKRILDETRNKTFQCSKLNFPCILAIGTLHSSAGYRCMNKRAAEDVLTGTPFITAQLDTRNGRMIGEPMNTTDLRDSTFVKPCKSETTQIEDARKTISAILLCSFGQMPSRMIGLLHPNPIHVFQRELLPEIEFGKLRKLHQDSTFKVEWC